jgi:hypothetical protein
MLQPVLIAALAADPAVAEIAGDRIHAVAAPEGSPRPYVVLTVTGGVELASQGAADAKKVLSDLKRDTVEIAAVADSPAAAAGLERAIEAVLLALPAATGTTIALVTPQGRPYDAPSLDPKQTLFAVVRLWKIDHRPTA